MKRAQRVKKQRTKKVMKFRPSLFWDVNPKTIDPQKHAQYIIERVMDFGNDQEVRWAVHFYSPRIIKDTVKNSRVLHSKSKKLWSLVFP